LVGHSHSPYDIAVDAAGSPYFMDFNDESVDGAAEAVTVCPAPTLGSRPRSGMLHAHPCLCFAAFGARPAGID
jgi:hypothetical protein